VIPTLSTRSRGLVKIHHYGVSVPDLDQIAEWSRTWCSRYGAAASKIIWFQGDPRDARTRLMLKTYSYHDQPGNAGHVTDLAH